MPDDILSQISSNPEAMLAVPPAPIVSPDSATNTRDANFARYGTGLPDGAGAAPVGNTWARSRGARASALMSGGPQQEELTAHHDAVADATAMYKLAEAKQSYFHGAQAIHDTGAFLNDVHGLHPSDPEFETKIMQAHADHPMNRVSSEQMQTLMEGRKLYLSATGAIKGADDEKAAHELFSKGHIHPDEMSAMLTGKISSAAARAAGEYREGQAAQPPAMNDTERAMAKTYGLSPTTKTSAYKGLYNKATSGDVNAQAEHDALWNMWKRSGVAAQTGPSQATPSNPTANDFYK